MTDRSPVCPFHRTVMIREKNSFGDTRHKCNQPECPIRWNPNSTLFYLRTRGDWPLRDRGNED
jgi:hypothetical protein